jgi:glycosyltransferase involved in cell wall biosynthesis
MYKEIEVIEKINNGEKCLSEVYNEIIKESKHDILVLCHDDIEFDTKNWGEKLLKIFQKNPDYGIIGIAGTTDLVDGRWWTLKKSSTGIVNHKVDGKKWESKFSEDQGNKLKQVVVLDGLFISFDKTKIKNNFDENFKGFHHYDLGFCFPNHLSGVKIGVTTQIRVTHFSVGATNDSWENNKKQFEEKYKDKCLMQNSSWFGYLKVAKSYITKDTHIFLWKTKDDTNLLDICAENATAHAHSSALHSLLD